MNKQAAKLIRSDTEPLIHLLDAQASLLEGDHEAAREKFERMLDDPEMRLLGLRGLYLEAERLGDRPPPATMPDAPRTSRRNSPGRPTRRLRKRPRAATGTAR